MYVSASGCDVAIKNGLLTAGWHTSCAYAATRAAAVSVGERKGLSAGSERKTCKDCATSTAWTLLWYGLSRYDKSRALYGEGGKERRVDGEGGG